MNEHPDLLETLKTLEPTQEKSWIHALPHDWLQLEEHEGNCDQLPSRLTPKTGCPKCGSAWLSVQQVAFGSECHRAKLADGFGANGLDVLQIGGIEPPMAVRLACAGDHLVEFDGQLLTVFEVPVWLKGGLLPAIVGGMALMMHFGYGKKLGAV